MSAAARAFGLLLCLSTFSAPAFAHTAPAKFSCEALLTGERSAATPYLRQKAIEAQTAIEETNPRPGFDDHKAEARRQQRGLVPPRAIAEGLTGPGALDRDINVPGTTVFHMAALPGVKAVDAIAVDMLEEGRSFAMQIETNIDGHISTTDAFASIPGSKAEDNGPKVFGKNIKKLVLHLQGGGTPTAKAANGIGFAKEYVKSGIATFLISLPGHGMATRDPMNLETFHKNAEWLLQILDAAADRSIPKVIEGHSWGAMWSVFLRRMMLVPKYRERMQAMNIQMFLPLAPAIDVSLNGDNHAKIAWELDFEEKFENYKSLIAPTDFEFQKNVLANGKDSDVGDTHLQLTDMDFDTRPLTPEEEASLPPERVIIGTADSLYVGREELFEKAFGSNLIKYGPGRSHKSPADKPEQLDPTGHQLMEVYIQGTETVRLYRELRDFVLHGVNGEGLGVNAVNNGSYLAHMERMIKMTDDPVFLGTGNKYVDLYERVFRHYLNFFGFRELTKLPQYVTVDTKEKPELSLRQSALDAAEGQLKPVIAQIELLEKLGYAAKNQDPANKKEFPFPQARAAIDALRVSLGLKGQITSVEKAQLALNVPELTAERKAELEKFVADIIEKEAELKKEFKDPIYDMALDKMNKKYAPLIAELRGLLPELQKKAEEIAKEKGEEAPLLKVDDVIDAERMRPYYNANNMSDRDKRIRSELSKVKQELNEIQKPHFDLYNAARAAKMTKIHTPKGVTDMRSANQELSLDRSETYKDALRTFIAKYDETLEAARQALLTEAKAKLNGPFPEGLKSLDEVRQRKAELVERLAYTYIPQGHEEIGIIARQIKKFTVELELLKNGPAKTPEQKRRDAEAKKRNEAVADHSLEGEINTVRDMRRKKSEELDKWERYFKEDPEHPENRVSSPVIDAAQKSLDSALESYKAMYLAYRIKKYDWFLHLHDTGQKTAHNILNLPKDAELAKQAYLKARATYLETRASFEKIRWTEAIKGHLKGPESITRKAKETARLMYGDHFSETGKPGPASLIHLLNLQEDSVAKRQNDASLKERQIELLKAEYTSRMAKAGEILPGIVHTVRLDGPLEWSKAELIKGLEDHPVLFEAFQQAVRAWDRQLSNLRMDNNIKDKDSGAY